MNGVVHYLVGLIITLIVIKYSRIDINEPKSKKELILLMSIIFILSFFSHILVDACAHFTYHPSQSDWGDPVYTSWHFTIYLAEAIFGSFFLKTDIRYAVGMVGSIGFDLWDWSIRRPLEKYAGVTGLPSLHWMADRVENTLFHSFRSLRNEKWALVVEIILILILFVIWRVMHDNSDLTTNERPATWTEVGIILIIFGALRILTLL